jgi:hypothetical protein
MFSGLAAALLLACLAGAAEAQTLTATAAGWMKLDNGEYSRNGIAPSANIITGADTGSSLAWRSFVSFAVPASESPYGEVELQLGVSGVLSGPNTLEIFDVTTNVATDPVETVYADLGTGVSYGSAAGLNSNQTAMVVLNAQGLAAVNAARGGTVTFGLVNATISPGGEDTIFSSSGGSTPRALVLTAPEPTSVPTLSEWAMILFGAMLASAAALVIQRRRLVA